MTKINDNGTIRDMTSEEEAQLQEDISKSQAEKPMSEILDERETLKASAKAKLVAGEALTEDEANTIVL